MRIEKDTRLSKTRVVTVTEKRRITVSFNDPLFPDETVRMTKTVTIKNGLLLSHLNVFEFLYERYIKKIGPNWNRLNVANDTDTNYRKPSGDQSSRNALVRDRNQMARAADRLVNEMVQKQLMKK